MGSHLINTMFFVFVAYFTLVTVYYMALAVSAFFQERDRSMELKEYNLALLRASRFTFPVSIIVPARNEERWVSKCISSLLDVQYPQFEIIIVDDGSYDNTHKVLDCMLDLEAIDRSFEDDDDGKVYEVYRSRRYDNISVMLKASGSKKAGALNAAVRSARYKYVCVLDADTILEPDALLKVMSHVMRDPERVIGAGSYFGLINGFKIKHHRIVEKTFSMKPLIAYQNLEYLRTFIGNRISWSAVNAMPIISGGFGLYRRDILLEAGGYDPSFSSEDLEMTLRVHDRMIKKGSDYEILMLPHYAAWTEGPSTLRALIIQRGQWQRVTHECVYKYINMLFNKKYKWLGFLSFPYFLFYESWGVLFEAVSISTVIWAWAVGIFETGTFIAFLTLMALSQAVVSLMVLFVFTRDQKILGTGYTIYLVFLSYLELFLYRWMIIISKIKGTVDFLMGKKDYKQYERS